MVDSVKGFGEIYKSHHNSMRLLLVDCRVDEVQKSDKVVRDRGSL